MSREPRHREGNRRSGLRRIPLLAAGLLLVMTAIGLGVYLKIRPGDWHQKLVGEWLRPDGGYVLTPQHVADEGSVVAKYQNPRPINVARARANEKDGQVSPRLELRDRNDPGNYHTLTYDGGRDQLTGVYHYLGLGEDLDVIFVRRRR